MSRRFDRMDPPRWVWTWGDFIVAGIIAAIGVFFIFLAFAFALATTAHAHESWISRNQLKNAAGEWCCGEYDCKPLNYTPKAIKGGYLLEGDEAIRENEVMRVSPEAWVICRRPDGSRRCVFAPMQSW